MAYAVLRLLRVRNTIAATVGLIYAFLPYHLVRRSEHLLLSNYAFIPLAVLFALAVMSDDPPVSTGSGLRPRLRLDRRSLLVLAGCVGMGALGAYYAVFGVLLFVVAGVAAGLGRRSWRPIWSAAVLSGAVAAVLALNVLPSIWYRLQHGPNLGVISRYPSETEIYGLRIQQLFSPRAGHRNATLARLGRIALSGPVPSEVGQWLGVVGALGVLVLLVVVVVAAAGAPAWRSFDHPAARTLRYAGVLVVVTILTAASGGFSVLPVGRRHAGHPRLEPQRGGDRLPGVARRRHPGRGVGGARRHPPRATLDEPGARHRCRPRPARRLV